MKYKNHLLTIVVTASFFVGCSSEKEEELPEPYNIEVITKAIEKACNGNCEQATIEFDFRDKHYKSTRDGGQYELERISSDSLGTLKDVVSNNGFERFVNGEQIDLPDSLALKYSNNVNSVHYFAQLPYGLNSPAVHQELIGTDIINDKVYYEVKITFSEEDGAEDFEDKFMFWVNVDDYTTDYIAYSCATNGGGIRFREAYNPRVIEGIRFVDYNNYKTDSLTVGLDKLDDLFENGGLEFLSKIETENVSVQLNKSIK